MSARLGHNVEYRDCISIKGLVGVLSVGSLSPVKKKKDGFCFRPSP